MRRRGWLDMLAGDLPEALRIVVIDDDQLVRDFAVHTIEFSTNKKVTTFESGFHAWHYIKSQPDSSDIIIADVNIPDMNGMELLELLKKSYPHKQFVITSSNPAHEREAYQMGAEAFLSKPFDVHDLLTLLQKLIDP